MSPPPAAVPPPSLKRARRDSESSPSHSPTGLPVAAATANDQMEAPLAVTLSQSMDSVNTATGEEEVSPHKKGLFYTTLSSVILKISL